MDFDYSPRVRELQARLLKFFDQHIYPSEQVYEAEVAENLPPDLLGGRIGGKGPAILQFTLLHHLRIRGRVEGLNQVAMVHDQGAERVHQHPGRQEQSQIHVDAPDETRERGSLAVRRRIA